MTPSDTHLSRDFIGYGGQPPHPHWPNGARLALNIAINIEEGSEPSYPDGDEMTEARLTEGGGGFKGRDLAAESMFEYGSRVGFWRINRLLAERAMPATVFACALALERNAALSAEIRARGYDVCAHGWRWERHQDLTEEQERDRIARTFDSLKRTLGQAPAGWYCRYGPSLNTRRLVVEHGGFLYDSDAYNDELPYWTRVLGREHLVVPYSLTHNDAKFITGAIGTAQDYFESLRDAFDMLYREGATAPKMMSIGLHQRVVGHPSRAAGLERFLDHVAQHPDVWVCHRSALARHWVATHPPKGQ